MKRPRGQSGQSPRGGWGVPDHPPPPPSAIGPFFAPRLWRNFPRHKIASMARSHPFGEMPLHAMAKAAVLLPLQIFEQGVEPPLCNTNGHLVAPG